MGLAIVLVLAALAVVAVVIASRFAGGPAPVRVRAAHEERPDILDVAPVRLFDAAPPAPVEDETPETITWTTELTAAALDESARLRLIDDLALLRAARSVALLRRAYDEERAPHVRARIEAALAACGEPVETTAL